MTNTPLVWNVFYGPWNGKVEQHNVFEHNGFWGDLVKAYKKCKREKETPEARAKFEETVRRDLMYYYWSKCEWEVVVSHWPPHIEDEKRFAEKSIKVDVYDQIEMNWDHFIEYVWSNRKLIK